MNRIKQVKQNKTLANERELTSKKYFALFYRMNSKTAHGSLV